MIRVAFTDPRGALVYFDQALQMGASPITLALDRGMARDLLGDPGAAQSDYRLAMVGANADEARRRIALSLAITGDRNGAIVALQPLLNRRDPPGCAVSWSWRAASHPWIATWTDRRFP